MITWPHPKIEMGTWIPMLGGGIGIRFTPGESLKGVLCDRLGIRQRYLEERIQTILVNSHPIDDPEQICIAHGDVVALSAAMPGLVGTTLRRGSHLAAMRRDITLCTEARGGRDPADSIMTLKLFNMVAAELGPRVLSGRILLKGKDLRYLYRHYLDLPQSTPETGSDDWIEIELPNRS